MRVPAILSILAAALMAQPATAYVLTYHCDGYSQQHGQHGPGDAVAVMRSFRADGQQFGGAVIWIPPAKVIGPDDWRGDITIDLQLSLSLTPEGGIGAIEHGALAVQIIETAGLNKDPAKRRRDLERLTVAVSIDGGPPSQVGWNGSDMITEWPRSTTRWGLISIPPTARSVELTVRDATGKALRINRYEIGETAGRDAQFLIARGKADTAAADYKRCRKMG